MRCLAVLVCGLASILAAGASAAIAPDPRAAEATGTLRVLVIRATWGPTPSAPDDGRRALDEVSAFYSRASFGRLRLDLDLTPWLAAYSGDPCLPKATPRSVFGPLGELAQDAARAAGYDPSAYGRLVYVLPDRVCGRFGGLGVGREVLLAGADALEDGLAFVHELGHTFGLPHATGRLCAGCARLEYGDPYSPMGHGSDDFTALEKFKLGWTSSIERVPGPGTYTIGAIDTPSGNARALVFRTAAGEWWIEHRVNSPHLLARVVEPNDPRHPVYMRSVFRGQGFDRRYDLRGVFSITAASADAAETQLTFAWTDRTPPTAPLLNVAHRMPRGWSPIVRWGASVDEGSGLVGYRVVLDGQTVERTTHRRAVLAPLSPGPHRITVEALDRAGNRSRSTARVTVA
jgi:hypothetical protein